MSNRSRKAQIWIGVREAKNSPARVLLFKVVEKRGGGWHPVTGGVDRGESFLEGAQREVLEETGFQEEMGEWVDLTFSYQFEGRFGRAEEHAFGFLLPQEFAPKLDPHEHTDSEWVSVSEAAKRVGFQTQRDALDRFSCYLAPR